jgi:tRNA threonylcarbamoyl adenosine modification protein YeaZ
MEQKNYKTGQTFKEMHILGIDSSTVKLSIAVTSCSKTGMRTYALQYSRHSGFMKSIVALTDKVLKKAGIDIKDIDLFCVNRGPGDFTGTRIGISLIKTFALVENKQSAGIDALDIYAMQAATHNAGKILQLISGGLRAYIVPAADIKRDEAFFCIYEASFNESNNCTGKLVYRNREFFINKTENDSIVAANAFTDSFKKSFKALLDKDSQDYFEKANNALFFCGTAFASNSNISTGLRELKQQFFIVKKSLYPDAQYLNMCAMYRIEKNGAINERIIPYYAREFIPFKKK